MNLQSLASFRIVFLQVYEFFCKVLEFFCFRKNFFKFCIFYNFKRYFQGFNSFYKKNLIFLMN